MRTRNRTSRAATVVGLAVMIAAAFTACAPEDEDDPATTPTESGSSESSAAPSDTTDCTPEALQTLEPGTLTIATDQPAYEPWMVDDDPTNGEGFEAAVAYAVAEELGYSEDEVTWTRVPFNAAIQPGPKEFDFDINQFTITKRRERAVDFSSPYYTAVQAVVTTGTSPAATATSLADLKPLRIGAQIATTSLDAVTEVIAPDEGAQIFNSNDDAKLALENGQVDAIVVDLPTAFYITSAELADGKIVGQLAGTGTGGDQFGLLLDKDSPLTACVSGAVDALTADGTLAALEQEWLSDVADAPVLE
jgi:polar amino acid transport system substrate-binding protein